jgi:hypothetical protein
LKLVLTGLQRMDVLLIESFPRALDLVNLLESHIALLTGGRDLGGHPLITFPSIGNHREKIGREEYHKVLCYLASITR